MELNKISYNPNFQAKIILGDDRIQKFVKSSFMSGSKDTFATLDKFTAIYPDTIISIGIKNINGNDYLIAKNGVSGVMEKKFLHDTNSVKLEDQTAFIDLIKNVMKKKSFWPKNKS